jgi:hypothetical protein
MIEDIVFLGAGASKADGAPLQGELLQTFFEICRSEKRVQKRFNVLLDFMEDFFGIHINNSSTESFIFPTFEEILGILELAVNRNESYRSYSLEPGDKAIQQIRNDLILSIATTLNHIVTNVMNPTHYRLLQRLLYENKFYKTAFISLNYDIIIDNELLKLKSLENFFLDYSVDITNPGAVNRSNSGQSNRIKLFKIHGSLNWLYCPTCISLTYVSFKSVIANITSQECANCKTQILPIIIPPSFFKVMSNYFLSNIWRKTEIVLNQAKRIYFCGYSFPDADIHIKYLLKRVENIKGESPEIYVINEPGEPFIGIKSDNERKMEYTRYHRFFKNSEKILYTNLSFQDFCDNGVNKCEVREF